MKFPLIAATVFAVAISPLRAEEAPQPPATEPVAAAPDAAAPSVVPADDIASLESKVGSEVVVEGVVKGVGKTSGDAITFINFGDRKSGFVAIVFRSAYDKFPEGFDRYVSQKVRVLGTLEKFQDRQIQIKISTPDQLEIVATAP